MDRNYLKGSEGDRINVLLAAAGYHRAKLLAWIAWALKNAASGWMRLPAPDRSEALQYLFPGTANVMFAGVFRDN